MVIEFENIANSNSVKISNGFLSLQHSIVQGIKKFFGLFGLSIVLIALLPLVILSIVISVAMYKKMAKKMAKFKPVFINKISNFTFEQVVEEERELSKLKGILEKMIQNSESDKDVFVLRKFYSSTKSIVSDLTEIETALKSRYQLASSDFFENEDDFIAYQKAMSELSDVWDYESTIEEKNEAFNLKKKNDESK